MKIRKIHVLVVLGLVLVLILSACGGSSGSGSTKVTMIDFSFQPADITVSAGKSVTLSLVNNGSVDHDFSLMSKQVTPPYGDKDKPNVIVGKTVSAGQTATLTFTAPSTPGDYEFVCTFPGHLESGMKGTLHVTQ